MTFTQERMKQLLGSMAAVAWLLRLGAYVCLGIGAVLLALILWMEFSGKAGRFGAFLRYGLLLVAAGIVALFSLSVTMPELSAIPRWVGTIGLFNFFIIALALFVGLGVLISDRLGVPVLALLVGFAIVIAFLDLNDNHVVTQVDAKNKGEWKSVSSEFPQWLQSRADLAAYQGEPYPVFIVSAAGGGLYAAQHAARFLARMQDHCPHFAQHIFAISGVSGGSVGAAVFASLVNTKVEKQVSTPRCTGFGEKSGALERDARAILGRDFLSPIVAATLFPDFLQRFVPTPIAEFDRGQVFDKALEAAWRKQLPGLPNPLAMPMTDLWDPKGHTPALVLNATHVSTGIRFAMAPFQPYRRDQKAIKLEWLQAHLQNSKYHPESSKHQDLKLSSAAGISARFPWVMPAATVVALKQNKDRKNTSLRLVDGGYFENSGAETAGDIIRFLDRLKSSTTQPFKVYMLVLTSYDSPLFGGDFNDETPFAEVTAPLHGLLSTRQARGDLSIVRTLDHLCPDLDNCESEKDDRGWHNKAKWIFATLNLRDSKIPLSWHLSEASHRFVGMHGGAPSDCGNAYHGIIPIWTTLPPDDPVNPPPPPPRVMAALNTANCAASIVCGQLANRKIAFSPTTGKMENYCGAWNTAGPALAPGVVPASDK
jgi:hypothetical protein